MTLAKDFVRGPFFLIVLWILGSSVVLAEESVETGDDSEEVCLADEAKAMMNEASSGVAQATADEIYGLRDRENSDTDDHNSNEGAESEGGTGGSDPGSETGWNAPDMASCVGNLGLDIDIGFGSQEPDGSTGNTGGGSGSAVGAACSLVGEKISGALDQWKGFTANNAVLGQIGVGVSSEMEGSMGNLDDFVHTLNERRNEHR